MPVSSAPPCFRMTPEARYPPSPRRGRRRSGREGAGMQRSGPAGGGSGHWGAAVWTGRACARIFFLFHGNTEPAPYHLAVAKEVNRPNYEGQNRK